MKFLIERASEAGFIDNEPPHEDAVFVGKSGWHNMYEIEIDSIEQLLALLDPAADIGIVIRQIDHYDFKNDKLTITIADAYMEV